MKKLQEFAAAKPAITIEIVAEFTLGGVPHDVVHVHQEEEKYILGEEAIRRADEDQSDAKVIRSDEHWYHAYEHRGDLPPELNAFWLGTARPLPDVPRGVSCLFRGSPEWCGDWVSLDGDWGHGGLVLRRRT